MNEEYRILKEDKNGASVSAYARNIAEIWPQDQEKAAVYFWHYVVKHASEACENVRRNQWHKVAESVGDVIVWWLSFTHKVTSSPYGNMPAEIIPYIASTADDILWHKYPTFCPNCFGRRLIEEKLYSKNEPGKIVIDDPKAEKIIRDLEARPQCTCLAEKARIEGRDNDFKQFVKKNVSAYAKTNISKKPESMDGFVDMFSKIYENNVEVLTIDEISFHLLEEVGEVSTALTNLFTMEIDKSSAAEVAEQRNKRVKAFAEELADVFSWSNSLVMKINRNLSCAADLVDLFYKVKGGVLATGFSENIRNLVNTNLVDLIWLLHENDKGFLSCEKCHESPCNPQNPVHKETRGFINSPLGEKQIEIIKANSSIY
jgi:NTP pyrophosphatase (non-canonical NTP hydrolase)